MYVLRGFPKFCVEALLSKIHFEGSAFAHFSRFLALFSSDQVLKTWNISTMQQDIGHRLVSYYRPIIEEFKNAFQIALH